MRTWKALEGAEACGVHWGAMGVGAEELADPQWNQEHTDSAGLPRVPRCPDKAQYLIWHSL